MPGEHGEKGEPGESVMGPQVSVTPHRSARAVSEIYYWVEKYYFEIPPGNEKGTAAKIVW